MNTDPIVFHPYFKPVIWGGTAIADLKGSGVPDGPVGESWEVSAIKGHESVVADGPYKGSLLSALAEKYGEELLGTAVAERFGRKFPVLVKIIDACHDLSLQVHPNDEIAMRNHGCWGKAEMWYVMRAADGARIYSGFDKPFTPEDYRRSAGNGSIMKHVACHESRPGQFYYLPPGTIHTLTAGNLVIEVQQSSDITYRIYDYGRLDSDGRPRPLHIEEAARAIDYATPASTFTPKTYAASKPEAVNCEFFRVDYVKGTPSDGLTITPDGTTFVIVIAADSEIEITLADGRKMMLPAASTALIPASAPAFKITTKGDALVVTVPPDGTRNNSTQE